MTETASPGPTSTLPDHHPIDTAPVDGSTQNGVTAAPGPDGNDATPVTEPKTDGNDDATSLPVANGRGDNPHLDGAARVDDGTPQANENDGRGDDGAPSAATATPNGDDDNNADERPAKRRRTRDVTPPPPSSSSSSRRSKPISPPWKKIGVEGPSSFNENGRRKSGRINTVPLELQSGDKRITRRAVQAQQPNSPPSGKLNAAVNGHATRQASSTINNHHSPSVTASSRRPSATTRTSAAAPLFPSLPSLRHPPPRKSSAAEPRPSNSSSMRSQRRSPSPSSPPRPPTRSQPARASRTARPQRDSSGSRRGELKVEMPTRTTPRIKLRTRTLTIPVVHPDQVKMRPRLAADFFEYIEKAADIPVEAGGLLASEDEPRMTDEMAANEAAIITRIERETEEGGLLTEPRCIAFEPEAAEEPPRQWAHMDHLVKAMANFRRLMGLEQQRHRAAAKKLAEACRDEWLRRQPKSAEQIEAEARAVWMGRYRMVVRALFGTWENVKAEVNRRRLQEWEAEEKRRMKAALQEAVARSEQKLQARRTQVDSELPSDEDLEEEDEDDEGGLLDPPLSDSEDADSGSDDSGSGGEDESNMSSEDEEEEDEEKNDTHSIASDEDLTQAQLRQKYADLSEIKASDTDTTNAPSGVLPSELRAAENDGDEKKEDDTSDESVDMDDDLGSTDMDSDEEEDEDDDGDVDGSDGDDESTSDDDEQAGGLLGMLFGKSELKKLKTEPVIIKTEDADDAVAKEGNQDVSISQPINDVEMLDVENPEAPAETSAKEFTEKPTESPANEPTRQVGEIAIQHTPATATDALTTTPTEGKETFLIKQSGAKPPSASVNDQIAKTLVLSENNDDNEVSMVDMPPPEANIRSDAHVPDVEVTSPAGDEDEDAASPETDAVTTAVSPGRSQSPRTLDTKPSDLDTPPPMSADADRLSAPKEASGSRSISPTPTSAAHPKTEIPFLLRGTLREYQHYGLDWLAGLYANNTNGILADEMGLGKTIQTIALLAHLACQHEVWGPHLIIVPTSVILNWEMEFKKWCPAFKILTYYGSQDERKRKRIGWTNDDIWNVCITSYQIVVQDQQVFKRRRWHYMILDEAHNIKNFKSQRWQSLLGFNTHSRLLLTGTPLQNNLTELWSLLFFLMPPENGEGGFADLSEFHDWFHKPESQILESGREQMDEEARAIIAKLHQVLRPYLLRRLKADVEKQMPAKYEHVEMCRLSKRQRELYDGFLARSDTRATLSSGNYLSIINCLMQLRKVCNHPDLFVDRPIMTSFRMLASVPALYESSTARVLQRRLQLNVDARNRVSLPLLNLVPTQYEDLSAITAAQIHQLAMNRVLSDLKEVQRARLPQPYPAFDARTVQSNLAYLENAMRWQRFEELQHLTYLNALRRQQRPIYGRGLVELLTLHTSDRPFAPRPHRVPAKIMEWFENDSFLLHNLVQPLGRRADALETTLSKFACVTPAVVTRDMNSVLLGRQGMAAFTECDLRLAAPVKTLPFLQRQPPRDPWHEARMRLTIQFPDKRLLQYDCGKLQALDRLLRRLQAGGHRALIFTQMTKVLDILERFLNIHGHKYLRLDGATKIEQRQILTDRFNHDNRILCFILSTRSGGLGINLTGADTVIFYDQDWNPAMDKQCQDRCHRIGQTRDVHIYRLVSEHTIEANILRKASQKQMLDDVVIQEGGFTTDYFNKVTVRDVLDNGGAGEDADTEAGDAAATAAGAAKAKILGAGVAAANAAMDRVLGNVETVADPRTAGRVLEQAEDREDVAAARLAEKEILQDDADFSEKPAATAATTPVGTASGVSSVRQGTPREGIDAVGGAGGGTLGRSSLGVFAETATATPLAVGADFDADGYAEVEHNAWGGPMHTIDDYMLGWMAVQLQNTPLDLPKDMKKKKNKKKGKDMRKR
ncbi:SNF2-related protein [Niveomyces insectorum RCEF 264]|uniref:DNA helicase n=1 Tax=Niveomyces insectorum RCEF 264 TaxID=1081102 RepID=A0A167M4E5_9HYPO|nr:SNF2-related protein [Niveomyces insectorum RCEF 264]